MGCSRCEDLKEEIAYLKSELGMALTKDERVSFRTNLGMDTAEAAIVAALYTAKGRLVETYALSDVLPTENDDRSTNIIKVYICRIRRKIGKDAIRTVYSEGYGLTPVGLQRVAAAITAKVAA